MSDVQLSIVIPFRAPKGSIRYRNYQWLRAYYKAMLPDAEIIRGTTRSKVFSKTRAVNNGVRASSGRIIAVVDADAYLDATVLQECADRLDLAMLRGHRRWFIPYRRLYRLTQPISDLIAKSDPGHPLGVNSPPPEEYVESTVGSMHGRRYGALMVIYPRMAFDLVGGMDARFEGWGGEDVAFARALDTLWGKHKTTDNDIFHLWHPKLGEDYRTRAWDGQTDNKSNLNLAARYGRATGDPEAMRRLVDEGLTYERGTPLREQATSWLADKLDALGDTADGLADKLRGTVSKE
jgi:glycosyltransferase involved in cell wall biosynthesis